MITVDGIEIKHVYDISTNLDAGILKVKFWHDKRMEEDRLTDISELSDYDYYVTKHNSEEIDFVVLHLPIGSEIKIETA